VHWRSDYTESVKLGETVAMGVLKDQKLTYGENFVLKNARRKRLTVLGDARLPFDAMRVKMYQRIRYVIARTTQGIRTQQRDRVILDYLVPQLLQPRSCLQILVTQLADHLPKNAHPSAVSIAHACPGLIDDATDGRFEESFIQHAVRDELCQQIFRPNADKLSRNLVSFEIKAFQLQPQLDRFAMIGRHYEDDAFTVTKPGAGEEAHCLPYQTFICVRIHDVAAWMRIR
jgi:hypothetical protein